ncbi:MAG: hypothetical protein P4L45_17260 [Ignavibacteriaceae bacterium]|nr:hypothetical protein [Ignavibacteriaceae bacterium]
MGSSLGFNLFDGNEIVYFGMFDLENAKEIVFRMKLLLQNLSQAHDMVETVTSKNISPDMLDKIRELWKRIKVEALINDELDKGLIIDKISKLTQNLTIIPWNILNSSDLKDKVKLEYDSIGDI